MFTCTHSFLPRVYKISVLLSNYIFSWSLFCIFGVRFLCLKIHSHRLCFCYFQILTRSFPVDQLKAEYSDCHLSLFIHIQLGEFFQPDRGILMAYMTIGSLLCARYYVKHLTYVIYLQFQMCEVGDHHHFTEVAGKTKKL